MEGCKAKILIVEQGKKSKIVKCETHTGCLFRLLVEEGKGSVLTVTSNSCEVLGTDFEDGFIIPSPITAVNAPRSRLH